MSMSFSTSEQLEKAENYFKTVNTPTCTGCARGVRMCYTMPCIGTVEDIRKIMDAGYSNLLMLDWWVGGESQDSAIQKIISKKIKKSSSNPYKEDIPYLIPAAIGLEGKKAPFSRGGKCTFLKDNLCSLHDQGLKPIQGKTACCKVDRMYLDENGRQQYIDDRYPILATWNTQEGQDLIKRWKKEINFSDSEEGPIVPTTVKDLLETLASYISYVEGDQYKESGCPQVDKNEEVVSKVHMHEKPF